MYHTMTTKFSFYESSSSPADAMKDKDDKMEVATVGSTVATSFSDECWATSTIPSNDDNSITSTREEREANLRKAKAEAVAALAVISTPIDTPTITFNNTANSTAVSDKLKELSNNRQKVMISIRNKLTQERDQLLEATGSIVTEVTNKIDLQEKHISTKDKHIVSLNDHINKSKAKNDEYAKQLGCLSNTVNDLVDENEKNIQHMSDLEKDVLAKMSIIEKMDALVIEKQMALDNETNEKTTLEQQLMAVKEDNINLKTTIEGLEDKNTGISHELEEVLSTLQEVVEENTALESQIEKLIDANMKLDETIASTNQKNIDLQETVEDLTSSLNDAKSCNEKLKMEHETTVTTAAKLADDTATSVGQLEKDIEEEFQVSTQLKRDMEDLKKKFTKEDNEEGANEIENLLASLRMVQVWQLSHFQRIGNLVFKNKEHARGLQSL